MTSLLKYSSKNTLPRLNRKVALRNFRRTMGNLEAEAKTDNNLEHRVDIKEFMNNPQGIYSKKNVEELESKLKDVGQLQRQYIDDIGVVQTILAAPTNDIESIKMANAAALKHDNMLSPDPTLIAAQQTAKSLAEKSEGRKKILRDRKRKMNR